MVWTRFELHGMPDTVDARGFPALMLVVVPWAGARRSCSPSLVKDSLPGILKASAEGAVA